MNRPYLQLALDCLTLEDAIDACQKIGNEVDILEAGTLLCAVCGMEGLKAVRTMFPDKIIVTDLKITDAAENYATWFLKIKPIGQPLTQPLILKP